MSTGPGKQTLNATIARRKRGAVTRTSRVAADICYLPDEALYDLAAQIIAEIDRRKPMRDLVDVALSEIRQIREGGCGPVSHSPADDPRIGV